MIPGGAMPVDISPEADTVESIALPKDMGRVMLFMDTSGAEEMVGLHAYIPEDKGLLRHTNGNYVQYTGDDHCFGKQECLTIGIVAERHKVAEWERDHDFYKAIPMLEADWGLILRDFDPEGEPRLDTTVLETVEEKKKLVPHPRAARTYIDEQGWVDIL